MIWAQMLLLEGQEVLGTPTQKGGVFLLGSAEPRWPLSQLPTGPERMGFLSLSTGGLSRGICGPA